MRVNNWVPSPGCLIDWDIAEIVSRPSCDVNPTIVQVCTHCGARNYDGWGWVLDGEYVEHYPTVPEDHSCFDYARDSTMDEAWEASLTGKRDDDHYEDVLNSIREHGFLRPLTAWKREDGRLGFGDGHHRLAAAIDLGLTTVPVKVYERHLIARDSGSWDSGSPIPTLEEVEALR